MGNQRTVPDFLGAKIFQGAGHQVFKDDLNTIWWNNGNLYLIVKALCTFTFAFCFHFGTELLIHSFLASLNTSLIEMTQKRINEETLQWIKNSTSKIFSRSRFEEAEAFFGGYDGTRRSFGIWQEKFLAEHKRVQQQARIRLMRSCGGSRNKYDIPLTHYLPKGLAEENQCLKCDMVAKMKHF